MSDFSRPCVECTEGNHDRCGGGICGCIAPHADDDAIMSGFKRLKRSANPDREAWVKGGWSA